MKKSQKRLGNKGFSLVELIVVIAIMAVLVGVLAPTLIRNVEKSRESTDLQNLDSIRTSVNTALSTENVANKLSTTGDNVIKYGANSTDLEKALYSEMEKDNSLSTTMKSNAAGKGDIYIIIDKDGKAKVGVYTKGTTPTSSTEAISCVRNDGTFVAQ